MSKIICFRIYVLFVKIEYVKLDFVAYFESLVYILHERRRDTLAQKKLKLLTILKNMKMSICFDIEKFLDGHGFKTNDVDPSIV